VPIDRRQQLTAEILTTSEQWLSPGAGAPCTLEQAVGSVARGRINAGRVITPDLLLAPIAVRRGDLVPVHCLSGNVRVEVKARALADARDGEMVELRIDGAKNSFSARMTGGKAVMLVNTGAETPSRENEP
jgi:flagella basal body P-ring formation protein FlgA